jgi:hypothetical protein
MILAIGFLQLGDLTFPAGDALLGFLHGVEGPLKSGHPTTQGFPLALQAGPQFPNTLFVLRVRRGWWGGANDAAAGHCHFRRPR